MTKGALKKRLIAHLSKIPEGDYSITEESYDSLPYYINVDTSKRHITVSIDIDGNITEDYRMIRGCGSKSDFEKSVKAQELFKEYHKKKLKKWTFYKADFDKMTYKMANEETIKTLTVNLRNGKIEENDRKRRGKAKPEQNIKPDKPVKPEKIADTPKPMITEPKKPTEPIKEPDKESVIIKRTSSKGIKRFNHGELVELIDYDPEHRIFTVLDDCYDGMFTRCECKGNICSIATDELRPTKDL